MIDEALNSGKKFIGCVVRDERNHDEFGNVRPLVVLDVGARAGLTHGDLALSKDLHDALDGFPQNCYSIGCHFFLLCNQY